MRRRADKTRRGAAAAELAVVLPFVSLMFLVALDFCRVYYYSQTIENCAYSAAMYASGNAQPLLTTPVKTQADLLKVRTTAAQQAAVAEGTSLNPAVTADNVQVTFAGGSAAVSITYSCPMLTPIMGSSKTVALTRQVTMAVAQ